MRILLTGSTGFLGSSLATRLIAEPNRYQVTLLKRSSSDVWRLRSILPFVGSFDLDCVELDQIFKSSQFDTIIHCATDYGRKQVNRSAMIEANLLLPLRLLEIGMAHGVRHFVNTDTLLDKRVSGYALSKRQFREWLESASNSINASTLLLEHFYGPGDDESKFVMYIIRSLLDGVPSIPLTLGEQRRDFIYIDDVVDAFIRILGVLEQGGRRYAEYEVGSGKSMSIREFVELAKATCRNDNTVLDFGAIPYRSHEPMNVRVRASDLQSLGWRAQIDPKEGLRRTIQFERTRLE